MYVRILTIGMGVFDMYLVLCAALQLHKLSIRCFKVLSINDFYWVPLARQIIDISHRSWSSNGIMLKATLPCLCWRTWCNRRGRASRGSSRRRSRRSKGGAWNRKKGDIVNSSAKIINLACNSCDQAMSNALPFKWSKVQQYIIEHIFMETDINSPDVSQARKQVKDNRWKQTMLFTTLHFPFWLILPSSEMKNDMSQCSLLPSS